MTTSPSDWQQKAAAKRAKLAASLPPSSLLPPNLLPAALPPNASVLDLPATSGLLTTRQLEMTDSTDLITTLAKLQAGEWSAAEVCEAFCMRAAVAQQVTGCLTEFLGERAMKRARELDEYLRVKDETVGPLHGLPVSVKDQFDIEGVESTMAVVSRIGRISTQTSALVRMLESLGAVIIARTNIPQTLLSDESTNNIFGIPDPHPSPNHPDAPTLRTLNPSNLSLTAGGSSGGEGALVAMKGSLVGFGTDLGGSIRKPAAFCGLYSLRPTSRRLPYAGASNVFEGAESLESVCGPMAGSWRALEVAMSALVGARPWEVDPKCVPIPWVGDEERERRDQEQETSKKCFGVMRWDGLVRPCPPIERGLDETVAALRAVGHEVIEWDALDHAGAQEIVGRIFDSDGGEDVRRLLGHSGEPVMPQTFTSRHAAMTVWESWQLNKRRDAYRQLFLDTWLATQARTSTGRPIDAILCPAAPHLAAPHLDKPRAAGLITHTTVWSLLDVPCYTFPVGAVDPVLDAKPGPGAYEPVSEVDRDNWEGYDPETFHNAPIVLQLVNPRRFKEDELLHLGKVIEHALGRDV